MTESQLPNIQAHSHLMVAATVRGRRLGNWSEALRLAEEPRRSIPADSAIRFAWQATALRWEAERISRLSPRRSLLLHQAKLAV